MKNEQLLLAFPTILLLVYVKTIGTLKYLSLHSWMISEDIFCVCITIPPEIVLNL